MENWDISSINWIALFAIFFARVVDVSIGTVRMILAAKGYRRIAPILGFFEVFIWITVVSHVFSTMSGVLSYLFYAGGFAAGNYVGILIESKINLGFRSVRIITQKRGKEISDKLREASFGITTVKGEGLKGEVLLIYTVVAKSTVAQLLEIVDIEDDSAFITIEDISSHKSGYITQNTLIGTTRQLPPRR